MPLTISEAAKRSGCTPPTIRYYESIGLVPASQRTASGRRTYGWAEVSRLAFIRRARVFGLGLPEVRSLLAAADAGADACGRARPVVAEHLATIRAKRAELRSLEASLQSILARCEAGCPPDGCAVFDAFGQ